jgi:hypothetical protein
MTYFPKPGLAEALLIVYKCKIINSIDLYYVKMYESEHLKKTKTLAKYRNKPSSERMSREDYYCNVQIYKYKSGYELQEGLNSRAV